MTQSYDDIIKRAAQFAPFAALTGYDTAIQETARLTEQRIQLDEYLKAALNDQLRIILEQIEDQPKIAVTYFQPDAKKNGGSYITATGTAKKIDQYEQVIIMNDDIVIPIPEILSIYVHPWID